jgi:hypothetical protein
MNSGEVSSYYSSFSNLFGKKNVDNKLMKSTAFADTPNSWRKRIFNAA